MSVLVYTEHWDGSFKKLSFELVSYAGSIAREAGTDTVAVTIGEVSDDQLELLGKYGADKVIKARHALLGGLDNRAYTRVLVQVAEAEDAGIIVLAHNNSGKALAPRLAVRLGAGIASGVSSLPASLDPFIVKKKVYSGKAFAGVKITTEKKVLTLSQNSFGITESPKEVHLEDFTPQLDAAAVTTEINHVEKQTGRIILTDAEIVVSGGRGMKSPDNWGPLEELAETLEAALACSRPVSDEGWRPHEEHTGQTGKIIAPNLYLAFGISGAIQHLAGVSSSKYIVAVNTDKDAPIFEAADYGIVGDAHKVLPELIKEIKSAKNQ
jgi:electron transfer flavoprotein alpha subunit